MSLLRQQAGHKPGWLAKAFGVAVLCAASMAAEADVHRGRELVDTGNCAACHGMDMNSPVSNQYPKLAGQYADYLFFAMRQYQIGESNATLGRRDAIMHAQLQGYSEADLRVMSEYIARLPGDMVVRR